MTCLRESVLPRSYVSWPGKRQTAETAVCKIIRTITPRYLRASREHEQSAGARGKRWLVVSRQPWRQRKRDRRRCARVVAFGMRWETKLVARTSERIHRQVGVAVRQIVEVSSRSLAQNGKAVFLLIRLRQILMRHWSDTWKTMNRRLYSWIAGGRPPFPSVLENGGHGGRSGVGPPD